MTFTEAIILWWLLIGLYYVIDTFFQDYDDQEGFTTAYTLCRGVLLLPVMPIMVVVSLLFKNLLVVGIEHESEESED